MPPPPDVSISMTGCNLTIVCDLTRRVTMIPDGLMITDDPHVTTCDQMSGPGPALMTAPPRVPVSADAEPDVRSGVAQTQ